MTATNIDSPFRDGSVVLEIGGGDNPLFRPNFDMRKLPTVDIVGNLESDWPIENEKYDGVFGKFVIEHISWRYLPHFISECYRVLKVGGSVMMVGPNTLEQCKEITKRNKIDIDESSMIFGGQEEPGWNEHKAAFSPEYAIELFKGAGFDRIEVKPWPMAITDMIIYAWKDKPSKDNSPWLIEMDKKMQNHLATRQNYSPKACLGTSTAAVTGMTYTCINDGYAKSSSGTFKYPEITKLNIGSFTVMIHDWLNLDILDMKPFADQNSFIFKQCDVTKGLPFDSSSINLISSSHLLEHISRADGFKFLQECFRVMKSNGVIRIAIPDAYRISYGYSGAPDSFKEIYKENVGVQVAEDDTEAFWNFMTAGHVTAYKADDVVRKLKEVGFIDVTVQSPGKSMSKVIMNEVKDMYPDHSSYIEGRKPNPSPVPIVNDTSSKQTLLSNWDDCLDREIANDTKSYQAMKPMLDKLDRIKNGPLDIGLISTAFFGCPPPGYSGLEQVVWDLACGLSELGHNVRLFAPEGSQTPPNGELVVTTKALNTVGVDWIEAEANINNVVATYCRNLDILHGHNWFGMEYNFHGTGPKICHTHHGHLNPQWWLASKPPYKLNFIAISKWMKSQYEAQGIQSEYVYNGIDLSRYTYQETKGDRLLYVGRISRFKQPHIAIGMAKALNVGLDIVGGTFVDDENYLKMVKDLCDGKQITFNPDVTHDVKVKFMQNAKCLLFPSAMGEPFGLVAAEAMACGTPVIALNDGAISEVVNNDSTGYICKDTTEMIEKYKLLIASDRNWANACRTRSLTMFSRKIMAENYVKLYRKMLAGEEW
jgi:glycosyltransferase involved in cell wall biosynthesis/predicted SAM-dependent methyltransferase